MTDLEVLASYSAFLRQIHVPHVVGGSLASSAWGEQRATNDADLLLRLSPDDVPAFMGALPEGFYVEPGEILAATTHPEPFGSFQALHEASGFKLDNFLAFDPWQLERIDRAVWLNLLPDVSLPFSTPEDMIIAKCRWYELGRRASERQWRDLLRLVEVQEGRLDEPLIRRWLGHYGLMDLWEALGEQTRR